MKVSVQLKGINDFSLNKEESTIYSCKPTESAEYIEMYMQYNKDHDIPDHFTVGCELIVRLYLDFLSKGYRIPNTYISGQKQHRIRPDKAIQEAFEACLEANNIEWATVSVPGGYAHPRDEERFFRVKHYKIELLPIFINFFRNEWLVYDAGNYFRQRDKTIKKYLPELFMNSRQKKKPLTKKQVEDEQRRVVKEFRMKQFESQCLLVPTQIEN